MAPLDFLMSKVQPVSYLIHHPERPVSYLCLSHFRSWFAFSPFLIFWLCESLCLSTLENSTNASRRSRSWIPILIQAAGVRPPIALNSADCSLRAWLVSSPATPCAAQRLCSPRRRRLWEATLSAPRHGRVHVDVPRDPPLVLVSWFSPILARLEPCDASAAPRLRSPRPATPCAAQRLLFSAPSSSLGCHTWRSPSRSRARRCAPRALDTPSSIAATAGTPPACFQALTTSGSRACWPLLPRRSPPSCPATLAPSSFASAPPSGSPRALQLPVLADEV